MVSLDCEEYPGMSNFTMQIVIQNSTYIDCTAMRL